MPLSQTVPQLIISYLRYSTFIQLCKNNVAALFLAIANIYYTELSIAV